RTSGAFSVPHCLQKFPCFISSDLPPWALLRAAHFIPCAGTFAGSTKAVIAQNKDMSIPKGLFAAPAAAGDTGHLRRREIHKNGALLAKCAILYFRYHFTPKGRGLCEKKSCCPPWPPRAAWWASPS